MRSDRRVIWLASLAFFACAATGNAQTTLRFQFKAGERLAYTLDEKTKMSIAVMGKNTDVTMDMNVDLTWNVLKVDSQGNAEVRFNVSSAKVAVDGPKGKVAVSSKDAKEPADQLGKVFSQIVKAKAAMEITGTMTPIGELKDVKVSEDTTKALKNLPFADKFGDLASPESFKNTITGLVFPKDSLSKGKTWSHKTESKTPAGKTITDLTYTFEGPVQKDGATLEKITVKPAVKVEADPNAPFKITVKNTKGSGEIFFNNKTGKLVESALQTRTEMTINANGVNLDQVIDQTVTLRAKK